MYKLDPNTHDLSLDAGGRLEYVEGPEALAQVIKTRLLFFKGESFIDQRQGVPWYQEILVKGGSLERVRSILRQAIASVPGVASIERIDLDLDRATRRLAVTFTVRSVEGAIVRSEDYGALVIDDPNSPA